MTIYNIKIDNTASAIEGYKRFIDGAVLSRDLKEVITDTIDWLVEQKQSTIDTFGLYVIFDTDEDISGFSKLSTYAGGIVVEGDVEIVIGHTKGNGKSAGPYPRLS